MRMSFRHLLLALVLAPLGVGADALYYLNWSPTDWYNNVDFVNEQPVSIVLYAKSGDSITKLATLTKSEAVAALSEANPADDLVWSDLYLNTSIDKSYVNSSYSYFVNVYNTEDENSFSDETLLFDGENGNLISYDDLQNEWSAISDYVQDPITGSYWIPNLSNPTPEPSSGLLLMMGGALLALRRRRQSGEGVSSQERRA